MIGSRLTCTGRLVGALHRERINIRVLLWSTLEGNVDFAIVAHIYLPREQDVGRLVSSLPFSDCS